MQNSPSLWRLNPQVRLLWLSWEDDYLLFEAASGQTHLLNELGAAVLRLFESTPLSAAEVEAQLLAQYDSLILDETLRVAINALLANLDGRGLLEPLSG